jgi:hypothetical protein
VKCYFESPAPGVTGATTGAMRVNGRSYPSLYAYYRAVIPDLAVSPGTPVVRVSFRGLRFPLPVAADRVWVRVMNDDVPEALEHVDKITPADRRALIEGFWDRLGSRPFGRIAPGLHDGFWRPPAEQVVHLAPPPLLFGQGCRLDPPADGTIQAYRDHYRQRAHTVEQAGCHAVPPAMARTLHCAYPRRAPEAAAQRLATGLAQALSAWT